MTPIILQNLYKYSLDKGVMATARSLKTGNPAGLQLVVSLGGNLQKKEDTFIVEAFGHFPKKGSDNFPKVLATLNKEKTLDTFFQKLVSKTSQERACSLLLPAILRLSAKPSPFNWDQLYWDIQNWEQTKPISLQYSWAQEFWAI